MRNSSYRRFIIFVFFVFLCFLFGRGRDGRRHAYVLCLLAAGDWRVWRESESPLLPLDRHRKAPKAIKALADGIFSLLVWWSVISFVSNERGSD